MRPRLPPGVSRRLRRASLLAALAATLAGGVALAAAPGVSWKVVRSPASVPFGTPTQVTVTITNTSVSAQIGCIRVVVPAPELAVSATAITLQPAPGRVWTVSDAAGGGGTIVTARASNGGSTIRGGTIRDTIGVGITVAGAVAGSHGWTAAAFGDTSCGAGKALALAAAFDVSVKPAPTPPPTPRPTPRPAATPAATTPAPTATDPATATPSASAHASPAAGASPSALPVPTSAGSVGPGSRPSSTPATVAAGWTADEDAFAVPVAGSAPMPLAVAASFDAGALVFQWGVPAVTLSVPGLLILIVVLAQSFGGIVWLPFVRRWIGGFGLRRDRS